MLGCADRTQQQTPAASRCLPFSTFHLSLPTTAILPSVTTKQGSDFADLLTSVEESAGATTAAGRLLDGALRMATSARGLDGMGMGMGMGMGGAGAYGYDPIYDTRDPEPNPHIWTLTPRPTATLGMTPLMP